MVSHSFFAHKKAVSHYSTKYNVTITLVFDRADLFGYPSPGSRDPRLDSGGFWNGKVHRETFMFICRYHPDIFDWYCKHCRTYRSAGYCC
jgi:hypothetical protein